MTHTFQAHSSTPNFSFRCGINGCVQTFKKFSAISSHIKRRHQNHTNGHNSSFADDGPSESQADDHGENAAIQEQDPEISEEPDHLAVQKACATLILTLKEKHKLTQTAVDFLIGQVRELINCITSDLRLKVETVMRDHNMAAELELSSCFENVKSFEGLHSEYMQSKFYKEHFDLIVSVSMYIEAAPYGYG